MKKTLSLIVIALMALLAAGGSAAEEENTWVTADGHAMALHAGHEMMFIGDEGGDKFDLDDLADGESRTFGEGDKQITATRIGQNVVIVRAARGDEKSLEIKCTVDKDTCQVITFEDDPEKVMIVVQKTRECVNGVGDCEDSIDVTVGHLGDLGGRNVHAIVRKVICDDEGNCETTEDVHGGGRGGHGGHGGHGEIEVIADFTGHGAHGNVMIVTDDAKGQAMLRCPEGDSTVHVALEEADETFLCPKHSVPMARVEAPKFIRKMRVEKAD